MMDKNEIAEKAKDVLNQNDRGLYTIPAEGLYPHQWLWDSCFITLGLRHMDIERAKIEILSLLRGQWSNGMVPHIIFTPGYKQYRSIHGVWQSWISPYAPDNISTSGITQPPMLAEAIVQIGEKLHIVERRSWYKQVYPNLVAYHQWLYKERDPHKEGLVLQIHPWETGLDNTPPWMGELNDHLLPWWIRILQRSKAERFIGLLRRDTRYVPYKQRATNIDSMALYDVQRRLRRKSYDINRILDHSLFAIEDLAFNSILVRANEHLLEIAKSIRAEIPEELSKSIRMTASSLDQLWDPYAESYFARDFVTHRLLKYDSIETLLPLYAGSISKEKAALLVKKLENEHLFGPPYPVPSVPLNSPWFDQQRYWQGPSWLNTNWLIADGLKRYGYNDHAKALIESSVEMVGNAGFAEYFNPVNGQALGASNFSWTASVILDWLAD